jgi:hypothetical protein
MRNGLLLEANRAKLNLRTSAAYFCHKAIHRTPTKNRTNSFFPFAFPLYSLFIPLHFRLLYNEIGNQINKYMYVLQAVYPINAFILSCVEGA